MSNEEQDTPDAGVESQGALNQEFVQSLEERLETTGNAVLVVDDEPMVRRMVARGIRSHDDTIEVVEAGDGREALDALEELRTRTGRDPVLIVTDLEMPVMDGWELIETLRKEYTDQGRSFGIPLIVLSSSSGVKGRLLGRKSVHGTQSGYNPIGTVAKEVCTDPGKYDGTGDKGIQSWVQFFLRYATTDEGDEVT